MPRVYRFLIALLAIASTAAAEEPRTITVDGSGFSADSARYGACTDVSGRTRPDR